MKKKDCRTRLHEGGLPSKEYGMKNNAERQASYNFMWGVLWEASETKVGLE